MAAIKRKNKNKLSNKFRISIFNDTTHEVLFSFKGNGLLSLLFLVFAIILITGSVTALISFTPLREFIPGYPSAESRRTLIQNTIKLDSLQNEVNMWRLQLTNIQRIVTGKEPLKADSILSLAQYTDPTTAASSLYSKDDSLLRSTVLKEEQFNISAQSHKIEQIEGLRKSHQETEAYVRVQSHHFSTAKFAGIFPADRAPSQKRGTHQYPTQN